jgi:hypothetical protein
MIMHTTMNTITVRIVQPRTLSPHCSLMVLKNFMVEDKVGDRKMVERTMSE